MRIFHIKSSDCSTEMKNRFADIVCAFATIGISQYVLMNPDEHLEAEFTDLEVPYHIQKFSGLFDLRTQQAAQQIMESYGPHVIQTHSPDSGTVIAKLNYDALRIGFMHDNKELNKKVMAQNNLVLATEYTPFGSPLDYNIITVPPLVISPGPAIIPIARSTLGTPDDKPLIGTMIDLSQNYELQTIFAAMREIPDLHCWIIGGGPDREFFENKARKQAVHDRTVFIEDDSNWPGLLKALNLCVVPHRITGIDRLTLEAWACGVPVLSAMDEEHSPITHGESGWFVEYNDALKWRKALKEILEDKNTLQKVAQNGMEKYAKSFDARNIVSRYLQSYETGLRITA